MANKIVNILATYKKAEDLINIGAYVGGSNREIDYAISMIDRVNRFLKQDIHEKVTFADTVKQMKAIFSGVST
jgi:flagellum-specific ATP synthase